MEAISYKQRAQRHNVRQGLNASLGSVTDLVREYRMLVEQDSSDVCYELEGRIGTLRDGAFHASVDRDTIDRAVALIHSNQKITASEWVELQDFFYIYENNPVRTRVSYDPSDLTIDTVTIRKSTINSVTASAGTSGLAIRVALSEERAVPRQSIPVITDTEHVRIQQRKTAHWSRERDKPDWQYDFSVSWSGRTKSHAEEQQNSPDATPTYTIEVELAPSDYLVRKSDRHIAASMLLKLSDFLPENCRFDVDEERHSLLVSSQVAAA